MGRGRKSGEAGTQRKQEILRAALDCFTECGFAATTMEHIRDRSKASTGSIYHHFSSKEQLAAELYVEGLRDYQGGLVEELQRSRTAERSVRTMVEYHLAWVERHPDWARYLLHSRTPELASMTKSRLKEMNTSLLKDISERLRPFVEKGEIVDLPADVLIAVLIGPVQEFSRFWLAGRTKTTPSQAGKLLSEAAWNSLRAKE